MFLNIVAKGGMEDDESLTPARIQLVQDTWKMAYGMGAENVGILFFKAIFDAAPSVKSLFSFTN
jgi:hypothetical protein